jgi:peptidyl-prolyl cis-trans isomerase D
MISEIRKSLKGSGFKVVLWITLLSMVVVFIPNLFKRGGEGYYATVATINGSDIDLIDFERRVYQETERLNVFRQQLGIQAESILQALGIADPKTMALNSLIQETLLNGVAHDLNIYISPEFVTQKLNDPSYIVEELSDVVPFYIVDQQGINVPMVNRYLSQHRLTMKDFETQIEEKIKRNMVLAILNSTAYVSQQQLKDYFISNYLKRDYTIVTFPFNEYLKKAQAMPVADQDVTDFFEKEHKKYWTPEIRSGDVWKFSPKDYGIVVHDKEIDDYYTSHKSQFVETPLKVQVRRILFKVNPDDEKEIAEKHKKAEMVKKELTENPKDFERLAREYSDDKVSGEKGGLIAFFKKGDKDPEFERISFRLQNDGDISDIITTRDGFEIIQRVERKSAIYKPLANIRPDIKNILYNQKFKSQFTDDASKILNKQNKEQREAAIKDFAMNKHAKLEKRDNIKNDGSPLSEKLFKLKQGDWTYLIADGDGILATVSSIEKSHKPEASSVKKDIERDLNKTRALSLLQKALDQMVQPVLL